MPFRSILSRVSLLLLLVVCGSHPAANAAGREQSLPGHDLRINIDTRWAGCSHGGYYPIRLRATNVGPARDLTFRFAPNSNFVPEVFKAVRLEQNATVQFTLAVPMVGRDNSGSLRVEHNGRTLKDMEVGLSLADADYGSFDRPSLLVVSNDPLSADQFEEAVNFVSSSAASTGSYGYYRGSTRSTDHEIINPAMLPDRWIDYTGLDILAVPLPAFEKLSSDVRSAMLGWMRTGGNLLIYNVGESPENSERLARAVEIDRLPESKSVWVKPDPGHRVLIPQVTLDSYGSVSSTTTYGSDGSFTVEAEGVGSTASSNEFGWKGSGETPFQIARLMQGSVIAFEGDAFPGSRHEWSWLLSTIGQERYQWTSRHGSSARQGSSEFLNFLIPGISGVPVFAFLVLITVFSIGIGPVNYYLLARRKRLHLLVMTIPLIAIVTSASLFGYSMFAHGFGTKSRVRSVTFVDQRLQKSTVYSRLSLYSGLAPSDGLRFTPETAVYPIWPDATNDTFEGGRVDWTNSQHLTSGWLRSRTRTQFSTVSYNDQRERLQINATPQGLEVSNGFPYSFKHLLVVSPDGKLYYGADIAEGAAVALPLAEGDRLQQMQAYISQNAAIIPPELSSGYRSSYRRYDPYYGYEDSNLTTSFQRSTMERLIPDLNRSNNLPLNPGSYIGILEHNPGVPTGVEGATEVTGLHLLLGKY